MFDIGIAAFVYLRDFFSSWALTLHSHSSLCFMNSMILFRCLIVSFQFQFLQITHHSDIYYDFKCYSDNVKFIQLIPTL